ncbi:hypothetical protein MTP99_018096 [Tenebrio molitor]|nr:hypothetical protein MTP99_018096 [Tenebrio molitor]CAH1376687.1 unnamed protein product [Tenebrio molitor]
MNNRHQQQRGDPSGHRPVESSRKLPSRSDQQSLHVYVHKDDQPRGYRHKSPTLRVYIFTYIKTTSQRNQRPQGPIHRNHRHRQRSPISAFIFTSPMKTNKNDRT